jgi:hypothetical protein
MASPFIEAIVQRSQPTDDGWQYKQAPQSIAVVKIAHAKKYSGEPKFSINAAHRSNVTSRRHPEHVRHPDASGAR